MYIQILYTSKNDAISSIFAVQNPYGDPYYRYVSNPKFRAYLLDQSTDLHTTRDPADLGISIRMEIRTLVEQIQAYF